MKNVDAIIEWCDTELGVPAYRIPMGDFWYYAPLRLVVFREFKLDPSGARIHTKFREGVYPRAYKRTGFRVRFVKTPLPLSRKEQG